MIKLVALTDKDQSILLQLIRAKLRYYERSSSQEDAKALRMITWKVKKDLDI